LAFGFNLSTFLFNSPVRFLKLIRFRYRYRQLYKHWRAGWWLRMLPPAMKFNHRPPMTAVRLSLTSDKADGVMSSRHGRRGGRNWSSV